MDIETDKEHTIIHVFRNTHGLWFAEGKTSSGSGIFQLSWWTKEEVHRRALEILEIKDPIGFAKGNYKFVSYEVGEFPPRAAWIGDLYKQSN